MTRLPGSQDAMAISMGRGREIGHLLRAAAWRDIVSANKQGGKEVESETEQRAKQRNITEEE